MPAEESAKDRYDTAVVRVLKDAPGRPTAGLGVLVGRNAVVTCAHVVNTALGQDKRAQGRPDSSTVVQVEFPLLPGKPVRNTRLEAWRAPPERGEGHGDVAGLLLTEAAPLNAIPARFASAAEPGSRLRVFGYPDDPPRGQGAFVDVDFKGEVGGELIQVESREDQTIKAQPGYSGSPVWKHDAGVVIGLLHATAFAEEPDRDAYLLPPRLVAEAWEEQFDYLLVPANPYKGLESFGQEDADLFFGRDRDIDRLAARLSDHRVVVIVGPSGVGKSSLVHAGLIPRLRREGSWSVVAVRPGLDPWQRIAAALLRAERSGDDALLGQVSRVDVQQEVERLRSDGFGPTAHFLRSIDRPLIVVVDQFEEALRGVQSPDLELLNLLLPAQDAVDDATRIIVTLRADYLPSLLEVPGVGLRLDERMYSLSPPSEEELRLAAARPAEVRGVKFDPGMVDQLVRDTGSGSLPLLQFTLTRLWETQRRKTLSFVGYYEIGAVRGALNQFAEQQTRGLDDEAMMILDRVLLRLVHTPAGEAKRTIRQRAYQADMPPPEWEAVLRLADVQLVIVGADSPRGPYVELAHEALITSWERLSSLVIDNADFLEWLAWIQQRTQDDPLPEARIAEARRWVEMRPEAIPAPVKALIENSTTAAELRLSELTKARDHAEALRLAAAAELALRSGRARTTVALALSAESLLTEPTLPGDLAVRNVLRIHPRVTRRLDHDSGVGSVAFSPDGTRVATGSYDGSARVFDATTGAELARLDHGGGVRSVAFSPDGTRVATGSGDGSARVFDATSGAQLSRLDHQGAVWSVAFSPNGTRVATGSNNRSARVFDATTGAQLSWLYHDGAVWSVVFSPDGTRVATGSGDGSARVLDATTGAELARLDHDSGVLSVAFSPDGTRVATGSLYGSARVFDATSGAELARLDHDSGVGSAVFSPDGTRVATGSGDGSARVFDATTGAELARLDHDDGVRSVAFSPDGTLVATGSNDGSARVFDATTGAELARLDHDSGVGSVAFSPDGTRVATGSNDRSARVFYAAAGAELSRLDHQSAVGSVAFSPDGSRVATGSGDGSARVFDATTGAELARLGHDSGVGSVAFSPDGTLVATGSDDRSARVFDATTGAELARLDHQSAVGSVAFSPDGSRVATGSGDGSARVFDATTGAELARLDHQSAVGSVAFSPDGTRVATGSNDRSARVFDATTGAELVRLDHDSGVGSVAFSPDGTRLATGSDDRSARVFDATTGAELARLDHDSGVGSVAFSPDGTRVATGSTDRSARVFDATTGAELARLDHDSGVRSVAFSPDGTLVATGSADRSARVFDATTGAELARLDHDSGVGSVAFSPDGTRVATGSNDRSARVFDADPILLLGRVFDAMTRPLLPAELRRFSLPSNCRHIEKWQQRQTIEVHRSEP